jgi:hypothetical protein
MNNRLLNGHLSVIDEVSQEDNNTFIIQNKPTEE